MVVAIPVSRRVDGRVAQQQQLDGHTTLLQSRRICDRSCGIAGVMISFTPNAPAGAARALSCRAFMYLPLAAPPRTNILRKHTCWVAIAPVGDGVP